VGSKILLEDSEYKNLAFLADALIVVSTIGLILEVPHIKGFYQGAFKEDIMHTIRAGLAEAQKLPNISGIWDYEVKDQNGVFVHRGISEITQDLENNQIYIKGTRTHIRPKDDNPTIPMQEIPDGIPWSTDFAVIYGSTLNRKLYFVYTINVPDDQGGQVRGYCVLDIDGSPPKGLQGTYTHLAPNDLRGLIRFIKTSKTSP
jgi:hypothetical protein